MDAKNISKLKNYFRAMFFVIFIISAVFFNTYLEQSTRQFVKEFQTQNAKELGASNLMLLTERLNHLLASIHWVCVKVKKDNRTFYERKRASCASNFYKKTQYIFHKESNIHISMTLRLPREIEVFFIISLIFYLSALLSCIWLARRLEAMVSKSEHQIEFNKVQKDLEKTEALNQFSRQIAHDIRSPLTALKKLKSDIHFSTEGSQKIYLTILNRIEVMANDLLDRKVESSKNEVIEISRLVSEVIEEKRESQKIKLLLIKDFRYSVNILDFQRVTSNIINNSLEAIGRKEKGLLTVIIDKNKSHGVIEFRDNGIGIPDEVMKKIGVVGFSFGKKNGNGLGIAHAKNCIEKWGGCFSIKSEVNKGTIVKLTFPIAPIDIKGDCKRIIHIEDDPLIRLIWKNEAENQQIEYVGVASLSDLNLSLVYGADCFIDFDLGVERGDFVASEIVKYKPRSIHFSTGFEEENITTPNFINSIRGKSFPF